jgi:hypothetical protein
MALESNEHEAVLSGAGKAGKLSNLVIDAPKAAYDAFLKEKGIKREEIGNYEKSSTVVAKLFEVPEETRILLDRLAKYVQR